MTIAHSGQLPSTTISFNLKPGFALGEAVEEVNETAARILPATIQASFQGTAATFQSSLKNLSVLLTIAVMVVYIVLGMLYESYIHPITILSGLAVRRLRRAPDAHHLQGRPQYLRVRRL